MADELALTTDVMATPEQVLAAGGVSKRRRGASSSKRRSPSGQRRRAATPDRPKHLPSDPEEETEVSPEVVSTVRRISTTEKALIMKRSLSSPGEGRQMLSSSELKQAANSAESPQQTESKSDLSPSKPTPTKRKSTAEKALVTKRSHSSPGDDRQCLPPTQEPAVLAAPRRRHLSHGLDKTDISSAKSPSQAVTETAQEQVVRAEPGVGSTNWHEESEQKTVSMKTRVEGVDVDSVQVKTLEYGTWPSTAQTTEVPTAEVHVKPIREAVWGPFFRETRQEWNEFLCQHGDQWDKIIAQRNKCFGALVVMSIYCGLGGLVFRFTEGAFEAFYKCGVKRVKRDFVDSLWRGSHHLLEDEWKSQARRKLMELETQLHAAHEAGVTTYSGQRAWSFLNAVVYCLTVVTTIGYGHISPSTTTGRAVTIVYAIFGIPMFLILLADFGKLFTRGIKFLWAFVRRVYYTGSCRKVRRTVPVQEVMKGVQLVYDFAIRRPSQMVGEPSSNVIRAPIVRPEDVELQVPLNANTQQSPSQPEGHEQPGTPALSTYEVDDEFNLPISVAIVILLIYIFVGAVIYWMWEDWGFFESFYFVFISMSTIGFGDFVPKHPMYMMASIVYLVFGLALTSMCINVVQEKLSDSFRQASAKIGATIGLRVSEEDGTITPIPPVQIEIPEVHGTITKSQST